MRKLLIISISIIIILALFINVMAKAVQLELSTETDYLCEYEETGSGKVILNNPAGANNFIVQVILKSARIGYSYDVWIKASEANLSPLGHYGSNDPDGVPAHIGHWYFLGVLATDDSGDGCLHSNIKLDVHEGLLSSIIVALNPAGIIDCNSYRTEFLGLGEIFIK